MKNNYIAPLSTAFDIQTEGVIATSEINGMSPITPGEGEHNGEFLSNRGGWSSEDWSDAE